MTYQRSDDVFADVAGAEYEKKFTIGWLSRLACNLESPATTDPTANTLLERAITLLAICSGSAPAEGYIRTFTFTTSPPASSKVTLQLREGSINSSEHEGYNSVGVQTWGSASVLSQRLMSSGSAVFPHALPGRPLRILELGAGTGLVSLAVAKFLSSNPPEDAVQRRGRTIILASDHDTTVLENLQSNIQRNGPFKTSTSLSATYLDWKMFYPTRATDPSSDPSIAPRRDPPFDEPFDLILGADVVYEPQQALWLKATVEALLRQPVPLSPSDVQAENTMLDSPPRFYLVIPLRSTHSRESKSVLEAFPRLVQEDVLDKSKQAGEGADDLQMTSGPRLVTFRVEEIEAEDRGTTVKHLCLEVGWNAIS